ncbi:MAG: hypothetical protein U1F44_00925 [Coriobacteriia bacterium]|nr:hypothetical protein [Coriobacteriia bacterium]
MNVKFLRKLRRRLPVSRKPKDRAAVGQHIDVLNVKFLRELRRRFSVSRTLGDMSAAGLCIDVPVARNRRFVVAAAVFGVPWLLALLVGSVAFLVAAPIPSVLVRVLAWVVFVLLTIFIHILAAMSIWAAFYQAHGTETFVADSECVQVLRTVFGVTLPARVGRSGITKATVLPEWDKRTPQPKIEVMTGKGAVRFGAGISHLEAIMMAKRANIYFSATDVLVDPDW